jgi:peptidoglycan/xylan/chitin deacetylase (PgdA/CDA1 family)
VSHAPLAGLPESAQREEIAASKRELERLLARPIASFSYPHGRQDDATRALVREAGFEIACASGPGVALRGCDPFAVPRLWPPDCGGAEFARWLRYWAFA